MKQSAIKRTCPVCNFNLKRSEYSQTQWEKGGGHSKCVRCNPDDGKEYDAWVADFERSLVSAFSGFDYVEN